VTNLHGFTGDGCRVCHHLGLIGVLADSQREAMNLRCPLADAVGLDRDALARGAADEEQDG